jgi:raffinose/stachyose/melibiose transport system substrate-binding protein
VTALPTEEKWKMSQYRPWMLALTMVLALCGLTAGPLLKSAHAQEPVELRVWDQFTDPTTSAAADAIYQGFTEQHPNVTIVREAFSTDQGRQTINTALSSGTGPDVLFYDAGPGFAGVLVDAGLLIPLEDMAAQYGWKDRIAPAALRGATIDGQLYGLPLQVDLIGMFYNKTLIDQEGLTLPDSTDALKTFCGQAQEKGYVPLAFSDNPGWQAGHQFSMSSTNMVGPDTMGQLLYEHQGSWNTPEIVKAIQTYFLDLQQAGCFSQDVTALTNDDAAGLFYAGDALMYPTGSWQINGDNGIVANMPDAEVGFMSFPAIPGGKGSFWVSGVGSAYFISAQSQHQQEAAEFLDYLFSPEAAQRWVGEAGFVVPMAVDTADLQVSPLFRSVLDTLEQASSGKVQLGYNIDVLAPPGFNDVMTNGFQAMLVGDKTAEQQAADLQAAWEEGISAPEATPAP